MNKFDLTGKKVILTGGNTGLGYGMGEGLLEAGCGDVDYWINSFNNWDNI